MVCLYEVLVTNNPLYLNKSPKQRPWKKFSAGNVELLYLCTLVRVEEPLREQATQTIRYAQNND